MSYFSVTIRGARLKKRMSQDRVAELVGVRQATLSDWENGVRISKDESKLKKLAEILSIPTESLLRIAREGIKTDEVVISQPILVRVCGAVFRQTPSDSFMLEDFNLLLQEVGKIEEKIGAPLTIEQITSLISRSFAK